MQDADVVIGQSSYDSVHDLYRAIAMLKTKMKPGAIFAHFQEVFPLIGAILPHVNQFPETLRQWLTTIPEAEVQRVLRDKQAAARALGAEIDIPTALLNILGNNRERMAFQLPSGELVTPIDEFQDRLDDCLRRAGFHIIESGIAESQYVGPRMPHHQNLPRHPATGEMPNGYLSDGEASTWVVRDSGSLFWEKKNIRYVIAVA